VYCVFDKDSHETYTETLQNIALFHIENVFQASVSVPCFEYWLLLHFIYTAKPYAAAGSRSIGKQVLNELKGYLPEYEKGSSGIFTLLHGNLEFAKGNAISSLKCAEDSFTDNPSTHIHELVEYLQDIKTASTGM